MVKIALLLGSSVLASVVSNNMEDTDTSSSQPSSNNSNIEMHQVASSSSLEDRHQRTVSSPALKLDNMPLGLDATYQPQREASKEQGNKIAPAQEFTSRSI